MLKNQGLDVGQNRRATTVGQQPSGNNRRAEAVLPVIMKSGNAAQSERAASDFFRPARKRRARACEHGDGKQDDPSRPFP
jgi:hypothetical protein